MSGPSTKCNDRNFSLLAHTRLGRRRRALLARAAQGPIAVADGAVPRMEAAALRRAAHALAGLGLVETFRSQGFSAAGAFCLQLLHLRLTPLGRAVVETFEREITGGRRVRWGRLPA